MLDNQKSEFFSLMKATLEVFNQPIPSQDAMRIWWNALLRFDVVIVRNALEEYITTNKFAPRPADIITIIERSSPDGRPSADEAWAMIPRDEYASAMMTDEMQSALHIAQPLLDEGDQIAARMAFKQAYDRLVDENKRAGIKAKWNVSLGWDVQGREPVIAEALRLGRIGAEHAIKLLPPDRVVPMLEAAGQEILALEFKPPSDEVAQKNIARPKEIVSGSRIGKTA